jgi:hypothetical protein
MIPKDLAGNAKWRSDIHQKVLDNPDYADVLWEICSQDPIFLMNGFAWTYDPRSKIGEKRLPFPKLPFILYPFQEDALLRLVNSIGEHDILIEKSRDMGASWLCMASMFWRWLFEPMQSFLLVSRVEAYVDDSENPKALMWKWDFLLDNLPSWLQPRGYKKKIHRRKMHCENPENGSVVDGESTNMNVARGDRRTAILLDEFAAVEQGGSVLKATRDATNSRIFNSTPMGTGNSFYDIRETNIEKIRLHWSVHPSKSIGLYTSDDKGTLRILDQPGYPDDYMPTLDGKIRSPWYDGECKRAAHPQEIAQELDIDFLGSGHQFFNQALIQEATRKFARAPVVIGDLEYDDTIAEPIRFYENKGGKFKLWFFLGKGDKPPTKNKVTLGVDVSAGTGSSNSCISGWDVVTNEKILEFASPYVRPEELARLAVSLARWLGNAFLLWEANGPGRQFGDRVMELGYGNIYYKKKDESITKKSTTIPGWHATRETKLVLLGSYRNMIEKQKCANRSKDALDETLEYVFLPNGSVVHSRSTDKEDPSGAGASHGDRVIADALGVLGLREIASSPKVEEPKIPPGSLAWRRKRHKDANRKKHKELGKGW